MKLKVLSSGSHGNCYLLESDGEILILDCGIPMKDIKIGLDFDLSKVVGALVTHQHLDHSKSAEDLKKYGIPVWQPYLDGFDINRVQKRGHGKFRITSFELPHDGINNCGFLIEISGQKILYMTDFEYCRYVFAKQNVNHILIECNYQQEYVDRGLPNFEHKVKGHCSLSTCKDFIRTNATDALQTVLLLHMGQGTCNPIECVEEIKKVANKAYVDYARSGMEVELKNSDMCPF